VPTLLSRAEHVFREANTSEAAVHHVGYWVPDLPAAAEAASRTLGIGPFLLHRHVRFDSFRLADGTEITDPAYLDHSAAFAAWGPIVLELAEVHTVDSELAGAYGISIRTAGVRSAGVRSAGVRSAGERRRPTPTQVEPDPSTAFERVGHVSWVVDDLDTEAQRLAGAGCRLIHTASTGAVAVAWFDGGSLFPHPIEVHRAGPPILGMHGRLAALADGWDGRDLLRPM
jgi:catechol 2,3-dioxygenase-like lactoylglutathione lyase family enzyme